MKKIVLKDIKKLILDQELNEVKKIIRDIQSYELSNIIEMLNQTEQAVMFRLLEKNKALEVFENLNIDVQQDIIISLKDTKANEIFLGLEPDDRAHLLDELPASVATKLLNQLSEKERAYTVLVMGYPDGTVGHVMTPKFISFKADITVKQALEKIRQIGSSYESIYQMFVTDASKKLIGGVSLKDLVMTDENVLLTDIMDTNQPYAYAEDKEERISEVIKETNLFALPIVDREERLIGIFTIDDAMDILEEESIDKAYDKVGLISLNKLESNRSKVLVSGSIFKVLKVRVPILILTLIGGLIAGGMIEVFEETLNSIVAVAFFIPVVMDMGGNVGTQSSTIFTRALVLGQIDFKNFTKHWFREIGIGFVIGSLLGLVTAILAGYWQNDYALGIVVGVSLALTVVIASLLGYLVPYVLAKLGFDQAAGADPIITTIKDISGLFVYFLLVSTFLL